MSEQLKQQGKNAYIDVGDYRIYIDVGATTLNQLQQSGILLDCDLNGNLKKKPDRIILKKDLANKKYTLHVIGENKDIKDFDTEVKRVAALNQAIEIAKIFKSPTVPIVYCTDGSHYLYAVLKGKGKNQDYKIVKNEDGYLFNEQIIFEHSNTDLNEDSIQVLENILSKTNDEGQFVLEKEVNPSNLATRVWQKTWIAKKVKPQQALSLFIEIFVLKYLSDLGIFGSHVTANGGHVISFDSVFNKTNSYDCLPYYFDIVRPYIKTTFPSNVENEHFYPTTIINGLPLNPNDKDDAETFYGILKEFNDFGKLTNISKDFKTRLFEDFLKGTQIIADRGQYFTPRKVVQAIVDMADIPSYRGDTLDICDPACGVGGFIFEALNKVKNKINLKTSDDSNNGVRFYGYDINEDEKHAITGVLGKANCLIYLSDKFASKPKLVSGLSNFINKTLFSYKNTKLGSLSEIYFNKYDLVLTNPPYVVRGSKDIKESLQKKGLKYKFYGTGLESIFVEKIIYELKNNGRAFMVLPDGIFSRAKKNLRDFIYNNCLIEGIIGLPTNTFFNTTKKTYILIVKKMPLIDKNKINTRKTFIYDAQSIGETLDSNRFDTFGDNDLKSASYLFKMFTSISNNISDNEKENAENEFNTWLQLQNNKNLDLIDESTLLTRPDWIFKEPEFKEEEDTESIISKLHDINSDINKLIDLLRS